MKQEEKNLQEIENKQEVNQSEEKAEMQEIDERKGLIAKFKALSFGKKVMVMLLLTGTVAGGAFVIYNLIKKDPKAVADAIEAVSENPEVVADVVEEVKAK